MPTLYLTEPGSFIRKDGDTLVVQIPENPERGTPQRKVRVPLLKVTQVVIYGNITLTTPVLTTLLEQQVDICYCTRWGRFLGRLTPPMGKNSLVRLAQHQVHNDPPRAFALARAFVRGKAAAMRTMLMRANRKRNDEEVTRAAASLKGVLSQLDALDPSQVTAPPDPAVPQADSAYGTLLGLEGAGTAAYFGAFGRLLNDDWGFERRRRRPPPDPVNSLLSFGYVLLMNQVASAVRIVGLDPYVGFLHSSQYGKPALALDVMETFRPLITDSVVLTVLNTGMVKRQDFTETLGAWRLTDHGRRTFLEKFEERLETEIRHPTFNYRATYRRCLELEVRLVSKALTGEISQFRAFVVR